MQFFRRAFAVLAFVSAPLAFAQTYPSAPITMVVPFAAGSGTDAVARIVAKRLGERLKQPVLVDNKAGASAQIGAQFVAKAKPDGYTLLINHMGLSTIPALYKKVAFDPLASFEFVGLYAEAPMMIMARKEFAPKTFAELVAYAKAHPDKFTMASAGMGSATHLCAILFQQVVGVPITIVQYKGAGPAVIDVRSGQVDAICDLPTTTSSMVRSGEWRGYLLTAPQRLASLPDVPTSAELGVPSLDIAVWFALYAPVGTPQPIVMALNKALREIVQDKAVAEKLATIETYLLPLDQATPEAHRAKLAAQIARWTSILEKAGIQAD